MDRGLGDNLPIMIVGSGRSGTTLLYEVMAGHPDVSWISNITDRFALLPELALLSRLSTLGWSAAPFPVEGYRTWDHCTAGVSNPMGRLDDSQVQQSFRHRIGRTINAHLRFHGRGRFLNKNTRNTRRILFLEALLSGPLFVHVVRNPRDVVASMIRVPFWKSLSIWMRGGITPEEWQRQGGSEVVLASELWAAEVSTARADAALLQGERYMEVRYEDFVSEPRETLGQLLEHCRLSTKYLSSDFVERFRISTGSIGRFGQTLSDEEVSTIDSLTRDLAEKLGYN